MGDTQPAPGPERAGFSTFSGVFRPVVLTIMGAMVYLREGWLVGGLGLPGALLVILAAYAITGATALSLASIASNVRVRPGGAFAIISQALGLEAGGAIGIPLFIAQAGSAAMYVYAFAEAWAYLFPSHPPLLVALGAFSGVALLAWRSAALAFRTQAVMLAVVGCALGSAALGLGGAPLHSPPLTGASEISWLGAFAIFFPAATGIMVGAGMSGSLRDPRRAIPRGTLAAWAVTLVLYTGFAVWYALIAEPEVLLADRAVMIRRALVPQLVLIGLLCSTLMASLSSLVAAPQLLAAMAAHGVVPASGWLSQTTEGGEARNAVLATTALAALGLLAGSLDAIAPLITSSFIMTYMAINGVVSLEQTLGMISWRPSFQIPRWAPVSGLALCLGALAVSSPMGGVGELLFVLAIYGVLSRRKLETPWETARSGVVVATAVWAARKAAHIERSERAWKPDLLVPVARRDQARALRPLVEAIAGELGSLRWVVLGPDEELPQAMPRLVEVERARGLSASWTRLRTHHYMEGIGVALDALQGGLFPPNLVAVDEARISDEELAGYLEHCRALEVGMALWLRRPEGGLEPVRRIDVWISDRSPEWSLTLHVANLDLPVLIGLLLSRSFRARLRLRTVVRDPAQAAAGEGFLRDLIDRARLPDGTEVLVESGDFMAALGEDGEVDLHILGIPPMVNSQRLRDIRDAAGCGCLWLLDSGRESALA